MRISTAFYYHRGVTAMLDQQSALSKTELQLATGKRILNPSDDPIGTVQSLNLQDMIATINQYQRNSDNAEMRLGQEETVLESVADMLQRVRELAVQANNGSVSAEQRAVIAEEVKLHLDGLLQMANTKDAQGDYLFSGFRVDTTPFSHDGAGNFTYQGDGGQRDVQVGATNHVATSDPGSAVFMGVADGSGGMTNTFNILHDFVTALEAGNASPVTLTQLDSAMDKSNEIRTKIGARMNVIENQKEVNDTFKLMMEENRSQLEDLDYAEAISRFEQQLLSLQASQQSFAKIQGLSLFNYL